MRRLLGDTLGASVCAALILGVVELVHLGSVSPGLIAVVLVLLLALAMVVATIRASQEAFIAGLSLDGPGRSFVRALGAVPLLMFVSRHLFDGSKAASLPGARFAHVLIPIVGGLLLVGAVWIVDRIVRASSSRRLGLGIVFLVATVGIELANRQLYRSEYPDVHAFLVVAALVCLAAGIRLVVSPHLLIARAEGAWDMRRGVAWAGAFVVILAAFVVSLRVGLRDESDRWRIATRGTSARQLVRVVRNGFDSDNDGYSPALGGGDCDDRRGDVNPGAPEVAGNAVDEDCDGEDLPAVEQAPAPPAEVGLAEWRGSDPVAAFLASTRDMNIVIVAVDALRADVALSDPAAEQAFPHLFAFYARSTVFHRAFSTSAGTDLAVSSVVTGRINPFVSLPTTLPEALRSAGRATVAVVPTEVLRYAGKILLSRGIDELMPYVNDDGARDVGRRTTTELTTDTAIGALNKLVAGGAPFYMWLHYFDVHEHLQVEVSDPRLAERGESFDLGDRREKYRALVSVTDAGFGRFVNALAEAGVAERTIIVLFSDHGESLGEDPRLPDNHGRFVYNALTHVPLAIHIPGVPARPVTTAVSILDLTRTLYDLAGVPIPDNTDGESLLPMLVPDAPPSLVANRSPLILNESEQWGVIDWPDKLMIRPAENLVELYNIESDYAETNNLASARADRVRQLKQVHQRSPRVSLDRTRKGRRLRDEQARPPAPR